MFVYFDQNGTLKEIIGDKTFRVGDSKRDKIYVYWEGEHSPISGWVKYRKPDGTETFERVFYQFGTNQLVGKSLPTKPLRNLKYFSYDHTYKENGETKIGYKFYEIEVPDEVLNSSYDYEEIPTKNNMVVARIRFVMDDGTIENEVDDADTIETLGAIVFAVETSVGILSDGSIDESQYNYLISLISMKLGLNVLSQKVAQLPEEGVAGTIYYVEREANEIIYDVYFWNGTQFVYMGTTSYDLYTKQEGEDFETAIQALWNAEMEEYKALTNAEMLQYKNQLNNQVSNLSLLIQAAASGSPKGVFATLTALNNAYPTGASGIYVVSSNGHWYYWSNNAWTDGGTYLENLQIDSFLDIQSSNPVQNKVIANMFERVESKNLLNTNAVVNGYILFKDGTLTQSSDYSVTDYIFVNSGDVLSAIKMLAPIISLSLRTICAYDANKNVIESAGTNDQFSSYTVPVNVRFVRISYFTNSFVASNKPMIYKGDAPTEYSEYFAPYYILKSQNNNYDYIKQALEGLCDNDLDIQSSNPVQNKVIANMFEIKYGVNLLDITKLTNNFITKNGTISASEDYKATDFIPVEEGQTISFQYNSQLGAIRFLCAYDENKQPVDASGSDVQINNYVVPVGIKYIRCSIYKSYIDEQTNPMIFVGTEVQEYMAYTPPKWILKANNNNEAYLISLIEETNANVNVSIEQLNFSEWQNYFDKDNAILGKYVYNGNLYNNNDYFSSDYIEVEPNTKYSFATASSILNARFLDEYNKGKGFIQKHESVSTITTGPNTKFLRVSFFAGTDNANLQHACVVKGETPVVDLEHKKLIPEKYLKLTPSIKIFLPKEICCAVGTTIEIYNDQVMPCADKYHFQWICNVGKALNRKFSVTGTNGNVGNYQLTLSIYDDAFNLIASGQATLKIVSPISTNKTICPIGDSLTNAKWWLHYVQTTLSSGKITYVGTRYYQPLNEHHEGRSGWSTTQYLSNSEYDYETPATPNPFWDASNSEFSWSYYKSTYSINPNAVQIWLGTNDLLSMSATQFVSNIKTMIEKIRNADATIPVFVCLTILPAEQNGIGNQQSNDGFASLSGRWQYQWWNTIIDGVSMLEEELTSLNDANLHIIPLVCSHDSKYNFGIVETPVNPHTPGITEPMPVEGVHPQQNGYEQIADILFGCYSAHL